MSIIDKKNKFLDKFLSDYNALPKNHNEIIEIITTKFKKELKKYTYIKDPKDLELGMYVKYVDLNIKKVSMVGRIIKLFMYDNNSIKYVLLYDNIHESVWKIKPSKYYLYIKKPNQNSLSSYLEELTGNYDIKVNKINKKTELSKILEDEIKNHKLSSITESTINNTQYSDLPKLLNELLSDKKKK